MHINMQKPASNRHELASAACTLPGVYVLLSCGCNALLQPLTNPIKHAYTNLGDKPKDCLSSIATECPCVRPTHKDGKISNKFVAELRDTKNCILQYTNTFAQSYRI
jgi:hypothetical protein